MEDEFIGAIRPFAGNYIPEYWLPCVGQLVGIQQYSALFAVIGNRFGSGAGTFGIPDLRSLVAVGYDPRSTVSWGSTGGSDSVQLDNTQISSHTHFASITTVPSESTTADPTGNLLAQLVVSNAGEPLTSKLYGQGIGVPANFFNTVSSVSSCEGGNTAHNNMQPYMGLYFIICFDGVFPPRPDGEPGS